MKKYFFIFLSITFFCQLSSAKLFKNSFVSFELPSSWKCELAGSTWNCSNQYEKKVKSAVIILAAKEVGPQDSLDIYIKEISNKPGVTIQGNKHFKAKKLQVKKTTINNQIWVDGLSYNSEAPDFYTRYLATIKNKISILVTFTSHKDYYTVNANDFLKAISSLKVLSPQDKKPLIIKPKITQYNESKADNDLVADINDLKNEEPKSSGLFTKKNIGIGLIGILIIFLLIKF